MWGEQGDQWDLTFFLSQLDFLHAMIISPITDYLNKKEAVNKFAWISAG